MANCNRKLLKVNVFPDLWSSTKKPTDYNICSDIWFVAKNVDDIELFTELYPFTITKPISDIDIISDNVGLTYQKPFTDYLSAPIDVDVVFFTKNNSDTEIFSELKYFSVNKILSNYNTLIDNFSINYGSIFTSIQNIEDYYHKYVAKGVVNNINFLDDNTYHLRTVLVDTENINENPQLVTTKPYNDYNLSINDDYNKHITKSIFYGYIYFEELYVDDDYIESNGIFINEYINILNYCVKSELLNILDVPQLNINKYIVDIGVVGTPDTSSLYTDTYTDINYFSGLYVGAFVKILH